MLCFTLAAVSLAGLSQSLSPATLSTGVSWYGSIGPSGYTPTTFTASGLSGGVYTWSLKTALATEDGVSQIDLGMLTSCANSLTCQYTAPGLYDTGSGVITLQATDGTHTASATITLVYPANLQEAFLHQGRMTKFFSDPWSLWAIPNCEGQSQITCYQPWPLWFDPVSVTYPSGTGINYFPATDRRGFFEWLPPMAGYQQEEEYWTRDGKWHFVVDGSGGTLCLPQKSGCGYNPYMVQADGNNWQLPAGQRDWSNFGGNYGLKNPLPLELGDGELLAQGVGNASTNAVGLLDLASFDTVNHWYKQANVYSIPTTSSQIIPDDQNNANISGYFGTHLAATQVNPGVDGAAACTRASTCTDIPELYDLDLSACYTSLTANCATLAHPAFSIYQQIPLGWDKLNAGQHCNVPSDVPVLVVPSSNSQTVYSGTLPVTPVTPGSVTLTWLNGTPAPTATDNGSGAFVASWISSGSVNYSTGAVSITVNTASGNTTTFLKFAENGLSSLQYDCEYHVHASGTRKGTDFASMNFGPGGDVGEGMGFQYELSDPTHTPTITWPDARYPTTGLTPPFTNAPYFGHGDWSFNGNYFAGSGLPTCTPNSYHVCTDPSAETENVFDFRPATVGTLKWNGSYVQYSANSAYGQAHSTWDTFDLSYAAGDGWNATNTGSQANSRWYAYENYIPPSQGQAIPWIDFGLRNGNSNGSILFWSPSISPDGTTVGEWMNETSTCNKVNSPTVCPGSNLQTALIPWIDTTVYLKYPAPPMELRMTNPGTASPPAFSFVPNFLNHAAKTYNVFRCTSATSGCSLLTTIPAVYQNIYNGTAYTFTDSTFTSGGPYWYGVATVDQSGVEGEMLSNTVGVTFGSGIYSVNPPGNGAGTEKFDTAAPIATAWSSATEDHLPDMNEPGVYPFSINQGAGGSLPDDYYWVFVTPIQCKDYPACATANLTTKAAPPSPNVNTIHVSGGSGVASITFDTDYQQEDGQVGFNIWMAQATTNTEPALTAFTLQTCSQAGSSTYLLPQWGQAPTNNTSNSVACTINNFSSATTIGTPADTTVQDFALTFTANAATDRVAYWDVYYAEGAAPELKEGEDAAQPDLIASIPASYCTAGSACTWKDSAPSIDAVDAGTHIFYGLVPVGQNGLRGNPSCWDATAGATATCN